MYSQYLHTRLPVLLLLLYVFFPVGAATQDLTGTWEGQSSRGEYVLMVLTGAGDTWVGYTYDRGMGHCKANFKGTFDTSKKLLKGEGEGFIEKTFGHSQGAYKLTYQPMGGVDYLVGRVSPKSVGMKIMAFGMWMNVRLRRINSQVDTTAYIAAWWQQRQGLANTTPMVRQDSTSTVMAPTATPATQEPVSTIDTAVLSSTGTPPIQAVVITTDTVVASPVQQPAPPPVPVINADSLRAIRNQRRYDTLQTIFTRADSIRITLYDNQVVDGDTVTVFHNNEVLIAELPVTARRWKTTIAVSRSQPRHEFVLVAKNLGRIPPNTALLIIEAGEQRYQLKASSDLTRNAMIAIERRE